MDPYTPGGPGQPPHGQPQQPQQPQPQQPPWGGQAFTPPPQHQQQQQVGLQPPRGLLVGGAVCCIVFWSLMTLGAVAMLALAGKLASQIGINGSELAVVRGIGTGLALLSIFSIVAASLAIGGRPAWAITASALTGVLSLLAILGSVQQAGENPAGTVLALFGLLGAALLGAGVGQAHRYRAWKRGGNTVPTAQVLRR